MTTETKKGGILSKLFNTAIIIYAIYQIYSYFFPVIIECENKEVINTLVDIFQKRASIDKSLINKNAISHYLETSFDKNNNIRTCTAKLKIKSDIAPFNYTLSWEDEQDRIYLVNIPAPDINKPNALFLLEQVERCDTETTQNTFKNLLKNLQEKNSQLKDVNVSAYKQIDYDKNNDIRTCQAQLNMSNGKQELAFYQVYWKNKNAMTFRVKIVSEPKLNHKTKESK